MFRNSVVRNTLFMMISVILLAAALAFVAHTGLNGLLTAVETTTSRVLEEQARNEVAYYNQATDAFGQSMADYLAWIASAPLWNMDTAELAAFASGVLNIPDILSAVVKDEKGVIVAGELMLGARAEGSRFRGFRSPIMREGRRIGSAEVVMNTARMEQIQQKSVATRETLLNSFKTDTHAAESSVRFRTMLLTSAVLSLFILLNTLVIVGFFAPLRAITRAISRFADADIFSLSRGGVATGETLSRSTPALGEALDRFKGELDQKVPVRGNYDFALLSGALMTMADLVRTRIRVQEAVTDMLNVVAVSATKEDLAWNFLRLIMKETGSCMAAFYIRNETRPDTMDLVASAGLPPESIGSFSAESLEGQFGAPILGNEVHVLAVPDSDAFALNTIAGRFRPARILTMPITVRGEPAALFTMSSFTDYPEEYTLAFSIVREGLNAAMANLLAGERERTLLQDLQGANQELAAQSEELEFQARELEAQNVELNIQRSKSEKASKLKTEFLSNMSHELRTPLNSILALSRVMRSETAERLTQEELDYLGIIEKNGKSLLALINGILDLSRIEAGREELHLKETQVGRLLMETAEGVRPLAREKGIFIECHIDQGLPPVITDEDKLRRVIINLVGNAMKFTDTGGVTLHATAEKDGVRIDVEDTGIGIEEEELPHIFDEFRQSDGSRARRFEGTGLGLAIVKKIADILGIEIQVESRPGAGSRFTLLVDLQPRSGDAEALLSDDRDRATVPLIYIIDDNTVEAMQLRRTLEQNGFKVSIFRDGQESLDAMESNQPDGLILDLDMPGLDGFSFLKELRRLGRSVPVLLMTARVLKPRDTRVFNELGVRFLALKGDVRPEELVSKARALTSREA